MKGTSTNTSNTTGTTTDDSDVQAANASLPILVTLLGTTTDTPSVYSRFIATRPKVMKEKHSMMIQLWE